MTERELIRPGDIVFTRNSGIMSRVVRMRTLSQWSCVGIVVGRTEGTIKVISAKWGGVVVDELRNFGKHIQVLRCESATPEQIKRMLDFSIELVGKNYDWCGILDFLFLQRLQSDRRWFCSELIYSAMNYSGIDILDGKKKTGFVSPGDLYESPLLRFVIRL